MDTLNKIHERFHCLFSTGRFVILSAVIAVLAFASLTARVNATTYCSASTPLPHSFESAWDGWTHGGTNDEWERRNASNASCDYNSSDPTQAADGNRMVGVDVGGCYNASSNQYLQSPVFDCSNAKDAVNFRFYRWLGVEDAPYDSAYIEYRLGGGSWTVLWESGDVPVSDPNWNRQEFDLSSAIGQSQVEFRFWLVSDSGINLSGWNLDYIEVVAVDNPPGEPSNVNVQDTAGDTGGSVTVSWTKSVDDGAGSNDVTGYEVWRKQGLAGSYQKINSTDPLPTGSQSFIDNSANSTSAPVTGNDYYYYIKVIDEGGNFTLSEEIGEVTPLDNTSVAGAPVLVSPANREHISSVTPTLLWNVPSDPNGDLLHFKVEISRTTLFPSSSFTENFFDTTFKDAGSTTADWDTSEGSVSLVGTPSMGNLDQGQPHFVGCTAVSGEMFNSQTFRPAVTAQLHSVRFYMKQSASGGGQNVTVQLQGAKSDGTPDGNVISSATTYVSGGNATWYDFEFADYPTLTAEKTYAAVLVQPSSRWFCTYRTSTYDRYSRGNRYTSSDGTNWTYRVNQDNTFETRLLTILHNTSPQTAQSALVDTTVSSISVATLFATQTLNGQTIDYYLSPNNGSNWEQVAPNQPHTFTNAGNQLMWRAVLSTVDAQLTPEISQLRIVYEDEENKLSKESVISTVGFSGPPPVPCCSGQAFYTVQSADSPSDGQYLWRVSAWDGSTYGPWSQIGRFTVDTAPPIFQGVQSVEDSRTGGAVDLTWRDGEDLSPPITFNIYRSTSSGFTPGLSNLVISGVSGLSYQDSGLLNNTTYYYIVRAEDSLGNEDTNTVEGSVTPTLSWPNVSCINTTYPLPHDFDSSDMGWAGDGTWERGAPNGGGGTTSARPDPAAAYSSPNVWGNNVSGDYADTGSNELLTSPSFDCSGLTSVAIEYKRWLNVATQWTGNSSQSDSVWIRVTNDDFVSNDLVYDTVPWLGWTPADMSWKNVFLDISSAGDNQSNVKVRYILRSYADGQIDSGWNIDDFNLVGIDTTAPTFAGIQSAVDAASNGVVDLSWNVATEPHSNPVTYNVYMATTSGGQNFSAGPSYYTTSLSLNISGLTNGTTYYFVVRAIDHSGNEDTNTVELSVVPTNNDTTAPVAGAVTPASTDTGTHVSGTFDLSASFTDDLSGLADGTCEYYCSGSLQPSCNGTWQAALDNWSGTPLSGTCSISSVMCDDGDSITLNMRVVDDFGNVGTGTAVNRSCDSAGPTVTQVLPTADSFTTSTSINSGDISCNDTGTGLHATPYDVQWCNDGAAKDSCDGTGTWTDSSPAAWSATNDETFTGTAGNWYRFRARCRDSISNVSNWNYSTGYVLIDTSAPDNPAVSAWGDSSKGFALTDSVAYAFDSPTGPYFEWTAPADNPGTASSGIAGFYVYFGTNASADPADYQAAAGTNSFTNSTALTSGQTYYLRVKTADNTGNISAPATVFTYIYTSGSYLTVTDTEDDVATFGADAGSTDGAEGVLAADNTDFEIFVITIYDEGDSQISGGAAAQKPVTVSLANLGASGAYISETNLGGATAGGASVSGTLAGGSGWIKVKATGAAAGAVEVSATATGLNNTSGRDQKSYLLVRSDTGFGETVSTVHEAIFSPVSGGTVVNPVWNHNGDEIVVAARNIAPADGWNLYVLSWNGSGWNTTRITNNSMCVQPQSKFSYNSGDDKVLFASKGPDCLTSSEMELYAVNANGTDNAKSLATLEGESKRISNGTGYWWGDVQWNNSSCGVNADQMIASMYNLSKRSNGMDLYMVSGTQTGGLFTESASTIQQVTNIAGGDTWVVQPSWSNDCSKITFVAWSGYGPAPETGVYILDLVAATLPITSLSDTGVTVIQECSASSCPNGAALYPSFSADDTMLSFMTDSSQSFLMKNLIIYGATAGGNLAQQFFGSPGVNFDNYVEYILDQPTYAPQLLGQSANNEFGLVQCAGPACPLSSNGNIFSYITQKTGTTDGHLAFLELGNSTAVSANGGLMFYNGAVSAIIPPGAMDSDAVMTVEASAPVAGPASQDDILVTIGEAREFYPDGVHFNEDVRLVFQYCDRDDNGYVDINQSVGCPGATGGDNYDENQLYIYYWCENSSLGCTANAWVKLDGSVDPVSNTVTVATNHFSTYDLQALSRGRFAPQVVADINLINLHTFPNPWRSGQNDVTFFADSASTYNTGGTIVVDVQIYDMRGKMVRSVNAVHSSTIATSIDAGAAGGLELVKWDATNNSGKHVASGVYLYLMTISDGVKKKAYQGKLSIVN